MARGPSGHIGLDRHHVRPVRRVQPGDGARPAVAGVGADVA
ncbi:hypothetical protein [Streptomyces griseorubiginosus]|nr:hypothetical protein [Streptomyces griseorubiginosus]